MISNFTITINKNHQENFMKWSLHCHGHWLNICYQHLNLTTRDQTPRVYNQNKTNPVVPTPIHSHVALPLGLAISFSVNSPARCSGPRELKGKGHLLLHGGMVCKWLSWSRLFIWAWQLGGPINTHWTSSDNLIKSWNYQVRKFRMNIK